MKNFLPDEILNKQMADYVANRTSTYTQCLDAETAQLFENFIAYRSEGGWRTYNEKILPVYQKILKEDGITDIAQWMESRRLQQFVRQLLSDDYASLFQSYLQLESKNVYTCGYYRRSQRSRLPELHLEKIDNVLSCLFNFKALALNDEVILQGGNTPELKKGFKEYWQLDRTAWLAAHIAQGNQQVIDYLRDVLTSENNAHRLERCHLRAIAISGHRELLELEGKLLLAARLQEGLRQAILETIDEGCPESFLHILGIVIDNDLLRYSSVKRALAVWTGIGEENSNERIYGKLANTIYHFLNEPSAAHKALNSTDAMDLYLALWSIGFYETENIRPLASDIIYNGQRHQVQSLFLYLRVTQSPLLTQAFCNKALDRWHADLPVMATLLLSYLTDSCFYNYNCNVESQDWKQFFSSIDEAHRHYAWLKSLYQSMPAEKSFEVLPWNTVSITRRDVLRRMVIIAALIKDNALKDELCDAVADTADSDGRTYFLNMCLFSPATSRQELFVLQALTDRSDWTRGKARDIVEKLVLKPEHYQILEDMLRLKYSDFRIFAIQLLLKQPNEQLAISINHLLSDKNADRRLAGLDIMQKIQPLPERQTVYTEALPLVAQISRPAGQEQILINALTQTSNGKAQNYCKANGFGLYDPLLRITVPNISPDAGFSPAQAFSFITSGQAEQLFKKLNELIKEHKDDEFKSNYGDTVLLGNRVFKGYYYGPARNPMDTIAFPELWKDFYLQEINDFGHLLLMSFVLTDNREGKMKADCSLQTLIDNNMYGGIDYKSLRKKLAKLEYFNQIVSIIPALAREYWDDNIYQRLSANLLACLLPYLNEENVFWEKAHIYEWENNNCFPAQYVPDIRWWLQTPIKPIDDELFTRYFYTRYRLYQLTNFMEHTPELNSTDAYMRSMDFARAWMMGLIPEDEVYREMMGRINSPARIEGITMVMYGGYRNAREKEEFTDLDGFDLAPFRPVAQRIVDRILDIELQRGDSPTDATPLADSLRCIYGADVLVRILKAFGKDTFTRENYWPQEEKSKHGILSKLLRNCYPKSDDTPTQLKKLAREANISDEKLAEAAIAATQWLDVVEKAIGWKGLASAVWYFRAHTAESCDDRQKAIIARYTPIDPEQLREGAFDIDWFKEAYKTIGKKRFEVVYDAAKYISTSNSHTRARKYADAVSGKMKATEVKKEIIAKRNKDLLMAYTLIPLGRKADKELLDRYQYLQRFLKESKEFGSQRQSSEKLAVSIALQNLARNSGYGDVTRLTWSMETELIRQLLPYLTPHEVEGIAVWVEVDSGGKAEIQQRKAGKALNNMPAKLKKHPYVEELKEVHKQLKDQYVRSRQMLEQSMEESTQFEVHELRRLMQNPVIWPLLRNLVFVTNDGNLGFYAGDTLADANGMTISLSNEQTLRIAHPIDLYASGQWLNYQKNLFDRAVRQPFKQVFRELYIPTPEEREATRSLRYAGYQLQPQKTVAILKKRRWVADYEDGLQKVYYKENIIATIYALADWFSPADIEAPTLEYVCFHHRHDYRSLRIDEVPPIIFSEVMRDVDLAVSVAHAGSVDPKASHSTIEMRAAIVACTLPLFHLDNVELKGNFAHITGKLGRYNIHLGSGVIHQEGGVQIAVLPVHSQARGRLFLPFVDDDPQTSEVLTKILFFAQDDRIKDPSILEQIR